MKNSIIFVAVLVFSKFSAQVAINKTTVSSPSVSLEFNNSASNAKGIVLPWVGSTTAVTGAVPGTMVYDNTTHKVWVRKNAGWADLSVDNTGTADISMQQSLVENASAKVSIGLPTSTPGILVLEDTNKAMILPKVASPQTTIINPAPGMMAYDTVTKNLAVFNGTVWTFWKP